MTGRQPARRRPRGGKLAHLAPERTLRRLELQVTRRLDGLLNGEHLGLIPGPGTELAEARLYQPGEDDVRHMDWAVTARTTTPTSATSSPTTNSKPGPWSTSPPAWTSAPRP